MVNSNRTFAIYNKYNSREANDYIYNLKLKNLYCKKKCLISENISNSSNYLNLKNYNIKRNMNFNNSFDKTQLYMNLNSVLDLKNINVISSIPLNNSPTSIEVLNYCDFNNKYNIDPSGLLFGSNICGVNNYKKYLIYNPYYNNINNKNNI